VTALLETVWSLVSALGMMCGVLIVFGIAGLLMIRVAYAVFPGARKAFAAYKAFAAAAGGTFDRVGLDGAPRVTVPRAQGSLVVVYEPRRRTSHTNVILAGHGIAIDGEHKGGKGDLGFATIEGALSRCAVDLEPLAEGRPILNSDWLNPAVYKVWADADQIGVSLRGWLKPEKFEHDVRFAEARLGELANEIAALQDAASGAA